MILPGSMLCATIRHVKHYQVGAYYVYEYVASLEIQICFFCFVFCFFVMLEVNQIRVLATDVHLG